MRHEMADLGYRIKLIRATGEHIQRGVAETQPSINVTGASHRAIAAAAVVGLLAGGIVVRWRRGRRTAHDGATRSGNRVAKRR